MATAEQYAKWIVDNQDKKGTPEFETVAQAYKLAKTSASPAAPEVAPAMDESAAETKRLGSNKRYRSEGPASYAESQVTSLAAGLYDPIAGLEQSMLKSGGNPVANILKLLDYGVGKVTGEKRGLQGSLDRQAARDAEVEAQREEAGRSGWDITRIGGNIANPFNLYMGAGAVKAPSLLNKVKTGAATGAISAGTAAQSGEEEDYTEKALFNAGFGAFVGGALPLTLAAAKGLYEVIRNLPISEANKTRALQKYVLDKAGDDVDAVVAALKGAEEIVPGSKPTAADVLADQPKAIGLLKEQQRLATQEATSPAFLTREAERQQARMGSLTEQFGTVDDLAAERTARAQATAPLREEALSQANVYGQTAPRLSQEAAERTQSAQQALQGQGRTATESAQAQVRADTWTPVPGYPRFPGRYSPNTERAVEFKKTATEFGDIVQQRKAEAAFKQAQLNSLKDEGFYPLETAPLVEKITKSLNTAGERSNDVLVNAQTKLRDKLLALTDENGIIDSRDLYNVRKQITDDIQEYMTSKTGNASLTTAAGNVEKTLKKQLDDAITKASGSTSWNDYLTNYAKYSTKIDQMKVGQEMKKALGEGALGSPEKIAAFGNAVTNAPRTIKRATGASRYDKMEDFFTPEQSESVNRVFADLSRTKKADELMSAVKGESPDLLGGDKGIQALDQRVTIFRGIMEKLRRGSQKEFDQKLTQLMTNPADLGLFIESIPKKDLKNVAEAMMAKSSPSLGEAFATALNPKNIGKRKGGDAAKYIMKDAPLNALGDMRRAAPNALISQTVRD